MQRRSLLALGAVSAAVLALGGGTLALLKPGLLGVRTFLHPVVMSAAVMDQKVEGWQGAPRTIYTDHFLETDPIDGRMGFKLEAPPLHPVIFASSVTGFGRQPAELLSKFPNTHVWLALLRDGFGADSPGGKVKLRSDGSPVLDYPFSDFVKEGARCALLGGCGVAVEWLAARRKV